MANAVFEWDEITRNKNGYLTLTAGELEREERYASAMNMWEAAKKAAKSAINKEWASHRAALCLTCVNRFGKRGV